VPDDADVAVEDVVADGATVRLTESQAQADLLSVLRLCGTGRVRCSDKTRRPSVATVTAVAEMLSGGDFYAAEAMAAFAWPLLVQSAGLAELIGRRLQLTARGRAALGKPAAETIRQAWRAWVSRAVLDELSRVEHIKGMDSRPRDAARCAAALERAIALTDADEQAAGYFHLPELYDLLAEEYEQLGRVDDALAAMRDALVAGWDGQPDGRCRPAEILRILLDPWWNPATEAQAVDRVHRIGQTRPVMVYRLVAKDTIEKKVMALKARKAELFSSVLDGGDFASTTLTAADIRGLLV